MFELQKFRLKQDEETLRRAEEALRSHLGSVVEIDGIELDRLLELASETVKQRHEKLREGLDGAEYDAEQAPHSSAA